MTDRSSLGEKEVEEEVEVEVEMVSESDLSLKSHLLTFYERFFPYGW